MMLRDVWDVIPWWCWLTGKTYKLRYSQANNAMLTTQSEYSHWVTSSILAILYRNPTLCLSHCTAFKSLVISSFALVMPSVPGGSQCISKDGTAHAQAQLPVKVHLPHCCLSDDTIELFWHRIGHKWYYLSKLIASLKLFIFYAAAALPRWLSCPSFPLSKLDSKPALDSVAHTDA